MAKTKKAKTSPKPPEDPLNYFQQVYRILVHLGIDPHDIELNYQRDDGAHVVIAAPESQVALAVPGDESEQLVEDGWHVTKLSTTQLREMAQGYSSLSTLAFEHVRRMSKLQMSKQGSSHEERLLLAILHAQLPTPDRNLCIRREDGVEITTPDFAWVNLKLAFYVDGLWWHVGRDDKEMIDNLTEMNDEQAGVLMSSNQSRVERDSHNRSEIQSDGWRVLSCTDRDLESDEGVKLQVERIQRTMRTIQEERQLYRSSDALESKNTEINIEEFL